MLGETAFKALSDPTRRRILKLLNSGELSAGQLQQHFEISGPSMSYHFSALKSADLVTARRDGQQIFYSLNTTVFQDLLAAVLELMPAKDEEGGLQQ